MKQQNVKTPLVFRVGIILLCMGLLSVHLMNDGFYARYSTKATGSEGAKVAYVAATANGQVISDTNVIDPASKEPYEYKVTVSNVKDGKVSEVTLGYTIYVDLPEDFPPMDISVTDAEMDTEKSTATSLAFKSNIQLPAGSAEDEDGSINEHIVSFVGTNETIGVFRDLQVKVRVIAEQID